MNRLSSYARLCRAPLSLFAACSAGTGFLLGPHPVAAAALRPFSAVFLLACGASALNQYQERDIDAKMKRTRTRPLPSGAMGPTEALALSLLLIAGGGSILAATGKMTPVVLGALALLWYNGVYTRLKRATAFAAAPGALVGMVPPAIGWAAAGGAVADPRLFIVCVLFFLWQVPHFWLQILHHGEDYERAGLPSLTKVMTRRQIARITFTWIFATATASLSLPLYGVVRSPVVIFSLIPVALWTVWNGAGLLRGLPAGLSPVSAFTRLNVYIFAVMSLLSIDRIFSVS